MLLAFCHFSKNTKKIKFQTSNCNLSGSIINKNNDFYLMAWGYNDSTNLYVFEPHSYSLLLCVKASEPNSNFSLSYFPASCFSINFGKTRWQVHLKSPCSTLPISASARENKKLRAGPISSSAPPLSPLSLSPQTQTRHPPMELPEGGTGELYLSIC